VDYSVWTALQWIMVYAIITKFQTFAEMHANQLLDSTMPEILNQVISQLPKRLMMVIKAKGAHVEFRLDKCVCR